jgi:hypothetical protein
VTQQIAQTSYVPQTVTQKIPVTTTQYVNEVREIEVPKQVCRYVQEQQVRQVPVQVCRKVVERVENKVPVQVTRYVPQEEVRKFPVRTVRYVQEERVEPYQVQVCRWVTETQVVQKPHCVAKWVPYTYTCQVPQTVVMRAPLDACDTVVGVIGDTFGSYGSSTPAASESTTVGKPTPAEAKQESTEPEGDNGSILKKGQPGATDEAPEADEAGKQAPAAETGGETGDDPLPFGPAPTDEDPTGKPSLPPLDVDLGAPA